VLGNPKAKRGYSRDKRPDCKQVVVGFVINRDGFPLAHEVFEGNRQDRTTAKERLGLLDERVGLVPGQTVVVDRGMAFDAAGPKYPHLLGPCARGVIDSSNLHHRAAHR
jgi:transposase